MKVNRPELTLAFVASAYEKGFLLPLFLFLQIDKFDLLLLLFQLLRESVGLERVMHQGQHRLSDLRLCQGDLRIRRGGKKGKEQHGIAQKREAAGVPKA